jgi:hypothetical protein
MDIEDVVLVVTVRETIRSRSFQIKAAEISCHIVAAQAGILAGCEGLAALLSIPQRVSAPSPVYQKQASKDEDAGERGGEHSVS